MAWNEPGGNNQDPWGGNRNNDGPPDLDEALKNLAAKAAITIMAVAVFRDR